MDYSQQLLDPRWQKKRLLIYERDNFSCQSCKSNKKTLNVHHKYYFDFLMALEYPDDLLITLCHQCHKKETDSPAIARQLSTSLQINGFLYSDLVCLTTMIYDKKFSSGLLKKLRKIQHG